MAAVYTAAWGLLLSASGRYWDDWAALDLSSRAVAEWSRQQGLFWQLDLLRVLSSLPGTERIGHALVFVAYLACVIVLYFLLRRLPVSSGMRVLVPVLFAVFPVNAARYALVDLMYAISLVVFMLAWWLVAVDQDRPAIWREALAAVLFLFSMLSTGSLLMFFIVVPAYVLLQRFWAGRAEGATSLARNAYLILLPVVAWFVRSIALRPTGLYASYNSVTSAGLFSALVNLPLAFRTSVLEPAVGAFRPSMLFAAAVLAIALAGFLLLRRLDLSFDAPMRHLLALAGAGLILFAVGVFPYLAVGKLPQGAGWESRHQLLVPFGAAVLVYAGIVLAARVLRLRPTVTLLALCLVAGLFVAGDLRTSLEYQVDWYKQVSLMQRMAESAEMERGRHFIFTDRAADLNAAKPEYAAYEYNGMMRMALGDATRFGVDVRRIEFFDPLLMREHQQYNCWEYEPTSVRYGVTITRGELDATRPWVVAGLMWQEVFAPDEFRERVADVVRIEVERLPNAY